MALAFASFDRNGLVLGAMALYLTIFGGLCVLVNNKLPEPIYANRMTTTMSRNLNREVCICLADDRFSEKDLTLANIGSLQELQDFIRHEKDTRSWGYWKRTAVINAAYALKHGHRLVMSNLSEYGSVFNESRKGVWLKPVFMLDVQQKGPECKWFAMMDSDAYFWMANHTVALYDWFSTKSLHEATPCYHEYEEEKRVRHGFYDWNDFSAFLLIGLNGVFSEPPEGYPNPYGGNRDDFLCAGVYFIRNSEVSRSFLHDWVHGPADASMEEQEAIRFFAHNFPLEQRVLNFVLYPRYKDRIHIHSYRDFGSKDGAMIRHVWSQFNDSRESIIDTDLSSLGLQ